MKMPTYINVNIIQTTQPCFLYSLFSSHYIWCVDSNQVYIT